MTIEFSPFSVSIEKTGGKVYEIDFLSLPEVSQRRVIAYGLTQILSDAAAPVATTANLDGRRIPFVGADLAKAHLAATELVEKRLADLESGILHRVRESSMDPVDAKARQIAIDLVRKDPAFKAFLVERKLKATEPDAVSELRERAGEIAKKPKVRALAEKQVADMAAMADLLADVEA